MGKRGSQAALARVEALIRTVRGDKVILDSDLALIYGVETKALNQAVKRNKRRFPEDFVFQLSEGELQDLRSQFVTSNESRGGRRYLPYAFTEHGAIMAALLLDPPPRPPDPPRRRIGFSPKSTRRKTKLIERN